MYSITENIYYSQLSSVAILLQPEPACFTSYNSWKWLCFLSFCAIVFRSPPASHVSSSNGQWSSQLLCVYYTRVYCPQYTSWSPQGMRVLRQYTGPRAEVLFVTIQRENMRPSKKEINKAIVTMLPNFPMFAVGLWITTSLCRWPIWNLPSTCTVCTPLALH
jgi:hypothetical protein